MECGKRRKLAALTIANPVTGAPWFRTLCRACFRRLYDARKIPKKA